MRCDSGNKNSTPRTSPAVCQVQLRQQLLLQHHRQKLQLKPSTTCGVPMLPLLRVITLRRGVQCALNGLWHEHCHRVKGPAALVGVHAHASQQVEAQPHTLKA
jgi:hypothetical protein